MFRKVLVLGDDSRSCLTVVRSLGRKGIDVVLGIQDTDSLVPYSRFTSSVIRFPSTQADLNLWESKLKQVLGETEVDLVIPTSDESLVPLVNKRSKFEALARLAIPNEAGFNHTYYKDYTVKMAAELNVPAPNTFIVESAEDLRRLRADRCLQFPLVAKPSSSKVWKDGQYFELQVSHVLAWDELVKYVTSIVPITKILIQEYFPGIGIGQEFLSENGIIQLAFQHERVHEPFGGGGSSYRKSVPLHEKMLDCSGRMLEYLRWTGVAMVEYKLNPVTGKFSLMEINGRFWGSLPLAVAAGIDFPFGLYQMLVENRIQSCNSYRVGLYGRNIARDTRWFMDNWSSKENGTDSVPWKPLFVGILNIAKGKERWDEFTFDDFLPGIVEIWRQICFVAVKFITWPWKYTRRRWRTSRFSKKVQKARVRHLLQNHRRLVFICRGNICRSPFAERYMKQKVQSGEIGEFEVKSAGTYPVEHRESPEAARRASREFEVNLDCHRSRVVNFEILDWADVVMCMDERDYEEVNSSFPEYTKKLFFLGSFDTAGGNLEISDPWGKTAKEFRVCYEQITSSIDVLVRVLRA